VICPVIICAGIMDCSDMPGVESFSEAPSHLRIHVSLLPSLAKIIVSSDVFIHLLELFQSLWCLPNKILCCRSWPKPLDHRFDDNLIWHRWRLGSESQESSDICLQVLFMVLHTVEQCLGSYWFRLVVTSMSFSFCHDVIVPRQREE
jgi:hypothetical protein